MSATTQLIKGPCVISYGGQWLWSKGDVTIKADLRTMPVKVDACGVMGHRLDAVVYTVDFEPAGSFLPVWNLVKPWFSKVPGESLLDDSELVIYPLHSAHPKVRFPNAALTRLPQLRLSSKATLWGAMGFTALRVSDAGHDEPDTIVDFLTNTAHGQVCSEADIETRYYKATWVANHAEPGEDPWQDVDSVDGWVVDFETEASEDVNDAGGVVNYSFGSIGARVTGRPLGHGGGHLSEEQMIAALNDSGASSICRGQSVAGSRYLRLVSSCGSPVRAVEIRNAGVVASSLNYGVKTDRNGPVTWRGVKTGSGALVRVYHGVTEV